MNPAEIIRSAAADGVTIAPSASGTIKVTGDDAAVDRWLPVIREHKPGVLAALSEAAERAGPPAVPRHQPDAERPPTTDPAGAVVESRPRVARGSAPGAEDPKSNSQPGRELLRGSNSAPGAELSAAKSKPDAAADTRRQRVIAMLAERPASRYAVLVDDPNTDPVLVTVGIRDTATLELSIPAAKFDAFTLLEMIGRHGGATVH